MIVKMIAVSAKACQLIVFPLTLALSLQGREKKGQLLTYGSSAYG
jgi:hypothetical protein